MKFLDGSDRRVIIKRHFLQAVSIHFREHAIIVAKDLLKDKVTMTTSNDVSIDEFSCEPNYDHVGDPFDFQSYDSFDKVIKLMPMITWGWKYFSLLANCIERYNSEISFGVLLFLEVISVLAIQRTCVTRHFKAEAFPRETFGYHHDAF